MAIGQWPDPQLVMTGLTPGQYNLSLELNTSFSQAKSKFQQNPGLIRQSPDKTKQRKSFDFLRRIGPFQRVAPTPGAFFFIFAPLPV
jgi:hypothetical protein